jgi:antitoxin component of RelBE/YafQ-DinJ toxin-antitoxin module
MKKKKDNVLIIRISESQKKQLADIANARGISQSELVRFAIDNIMNGEKK